VPHGYNGDSGRGSTVSGITMWRHTPALEVAALDNRGCGSAAAAHLAEEAAELGLGPAAAHELGGEARVVRHVRQAEHQRCQGERGFNARAPIGEARRGLPDREE
jgi:hypothetical protein